MIIRDYDRSKEWAAVTPVSQLRACEVSGVLCALTQLLLLLFVPFSQSRAESILVASTESETAGEQIPPAFLVKAILKSADAADRQSFNECLIDNELGTAKSAQLFRSIELSSKVSGKRLYFVRPALKPFCMAFYGAHLFRYWLVESGANKASGGPKVLYAGGGDGFEVLSSTTNNRYDLSETSCNAISCIRIVMKYNGSKYAANSCSKIRFGKGDPAEYKAVTSAECQFDFGF